MKATVPHPFTTLPLGINSKFDSFVEYVKSQNNFVVGDYIEAKLSAISNYMSKAGLTTAVIGISGGIDSAVAFELLKRVKLANGNPIKVVSVFVCDDHTSNDESVKMVRRVLQGCNEPTIELWNNPVDRINLERILYALPNELEGEPDWLKGQFISYQRQSDLYKVVSTFSDAGHPAILIGTINRSEGSYLGYMCKAGDNMVDLQIISDLYKSQVYALAEHFKIDEHVINRAPVGDLFDARTDEQLFGTDYDTIEFFLTIMDESFEPLVTLNDVIQDCGRDQLEIESKLKMCFENMEYVHKLNSHKYLAGSPGVHLDVFPVNINGGRRQQFEPTIGSTTWLSSSIPVRTCNLQLCTCFISSDEQVLNTTKIERKVHTHPDIVGSVIELPLLPLDIDLKKMIPTFTSPIDQLFVVEVDKFGSEICHDSSHPVAAKRIRFSDRTLSNQLNQLIRPHVDRLICHDGVWYTFVGVNPYFRTLQYEPGQYLVPHLDGRTDIGGFYKMRTLQIYLDSDTVGTEFVLDTGSVSKLPNGDMTHTSLDVALSIPSVRNNAIIFDGASNYHQSPTNNTPNTKQTLLTELMYVPVIHQGALSSPRFGDL